MYNLKKLFLVVLPSFVFQLILIFSSSVYTQGDDTGISTGISTSVYERLSSWYQHDVDPKNLTQYMTFSNILATIKDLKRDSETNYEKFKTMRQLAFSLACNLCLRKELDDVSQYYFPDWLKGKKWDRRIKWEAYFLCESETSQQEMHKERLKQYGLNARNIATIVYYIYETTNEKAHSSTYLSIMEDLKMEEFIPQCCKALNIFQHGAPACNAIQVFLTPKDDLDLKFTPKQWQTALYLELGNLDRTVTSDKEIRDCLNDIHKDTHNDIKIHHLMAGGDEDNQMTLVEYFTDADDTPTKFRESILSSEKCKAQSWVKRPETQWSIEPLRQLENGATTSTTTPKKSNF